MKIGPQECQDDKASMVETQCVCNEGYMDLDEGFCRACPDTRCKKCDSINPNNCLALQVGFEYKDLSNPSGEIIDCGDPAHNPLNPIEPFSTVCHREFFDDIVSFRTVLNTNQAEPVFDLQDRILTLFLDDLVIKPERVLDYSWGNWAGVFDFQVWLKDSDGQLKLEPVTLQQDYFIDAKFVRKFDGSGQWPMLYYSFDDFQVIDDTRDGEIHLAYKKNFWQPYGKEPFYIIKKPLRWKIRRLDRTRFFKEALQVS